MRRTRAVIAVAVFAAALAGGPAARAKHFVSYPSCKIPYSSGVRVDSCTFWTAGLPVSVSGHAKASSSTAAAFVHVWLNNEYFWENKGVKDTLDNVGLYDYDTSPTLVDCTSPSGAKNYTECANSAGGPVPLGVLSLVVEVESAVLVTCNVQWGSNTIVSPDSYAFCSTGGY